MIENRSPSVVQIPSGDSRTIIIRPQDLGERERFQDTFTVVGKQAGPFSIEAKPTPFEASFGAGDRDRGKTNLLWRVNCSAECTCFLKDASGRPPPDNYTEMKSLGRITAVGYDCSCGAAEGTCHTLLHSDCEAKCKAQFGSADPWIWQCVDVGPCRRD